MPKSSLALAVVLAPLVLIGGAFAFVLLLAGGNTAAAAACGATTPARNIDVAGAGTYAAIGGYSGVQLENAASIMNAAQALSLTQQAQVVAVMTAMGESSLQVLDHGDTAGVDSRGLFQQRDNGPWGTLADRMDPATSATNFLNALVKVANWESLDPSLAAHQVQGNADPYHYTPYFDKAQAVVNGLTNPLAPSPDTAVPTGGCGNGSITLPLARPFDLSSGFGPRSQPIAGASSWHPANDLQTRTTGNSAEASGYSCGAPIYAIQAGTVTVAQGYTLSIKEPAGHTVSYLHMYPSDMEVRLGDDVTQGQEIGHTGRNGPATGCHLDIRINTTGSTDPAVSALPQSQTLGSGATGFVDPEKFFAVFGLDLCDSTCIRR
jgi:murein DD-endopeptidase MepM/ murein hydrolase activator NlpD